MSVISTEKIKAGIWYPADVVPDTEFLSCLAFVVNGQDGSVTYSEGILLDACNCFEDGKWYPWGIDSTLEVVAWMMIPEYKGDKDEKKS